MGKGKVWLVGAGPSDAGLLTLKAKALLEQADVVLYDSLVGKGVLCLIPRGVRLVNVGKRAGRAVMPQKAINSLLLKEAMKGNKVVRLKGGDPFLFGRGGEELELLCENQIPFEIVPGVPSALAVPAYAGIPVTHRDYCSSVHIITGHKKEGEGPQIDFEALVRLNGTLVFLMGIGSLAAICEGLIKAGMPAQTPAAVLEKGTTSEQRRVVSNLGELPNEALRREIKTPAIIVVGQVCELAEKFHWAEDRPLGGVRVVVTRPQALSSELSARLNGLGAEVLEIPAIETVEIADDASSKRILKDLSSYGWLVFTSRAGVRIFFEKLRRNRIDIRSLNGIKTAAIGAATEAEMSGHGIFADFVPEKYDSKSLGEALVRAVGKGEKVLFPRARIGSKELTEILERAGIPFDDFPIYDTVPAVGGAIQSEGLMEDLKADYVAFTSASTVRGFANAMGKTNLSGLTAVCIGEQTAAEAVKYGMSVEISDEITIPSLADKIVALHRADKSGKEI